MNTLSFVDPKDVKGKILFVCVGQMDGAEKLRQWSQDIKQRLELKEVIVLTSSEVRFIGTEEIKTFTPETTFEKALKDL